VVKSYIYCGRREVKEIVRRFFFVYMDEERKNEKK
jgi:hypothetical protein